MIMDAIPITSQLPPLSQRKILLTTFGSFGDLHPYIALALELRQRGHQPTIATSSIYAEKIRALGIDFAPIRPDMPSDPLEMRALGAKVMDFHQGPKFVLRDLCLASLRVSLADLTPWAQQADFIVGHPLMLSVPLLAERFDKPWASVALAPVSYFSVQDPPCFPGMAWLTKTGRFRARLYRMLYAMLRGRIDGWSKDYHVLRAELGLPVDRRNPIVDAQHSPLLSLAMFSSQLAQVQTDWPASAHITGYAFYDQDGDSALSPAITQFLQAGPRPIVFTLGTSGVLTPGEFYTEAIRTAKQLGERAILLVGKYAGGPEIREPLTSDILIADYAPYSQLFPHASVIVHQGGAGTTGQALRAGRPMLIVPFSHDQPDNALRIERIGCGRILARSKFRGDRAARAILPMLVDEGYAQRAAAVAQQVRAELGAAGAVDRIEACLRESMAASGTV